MKLGVRAGVIGAGFLALGAMGGTAQAQAWIGQIAGNMAAAQAAAQREHDCMMGLEMSDAEVNETRISTRATMAQYWQSVAGRQSADVRGSFHDDGKARWNLGDKVVWHEGLTRIKDPLAPAGGTLDPEPRSYLRSGDGKAVSGLWAVRGPSGDAIGFYDAQFTRVAGTWKLRSLTVFDPATAPSALVQYCHNPGDVEPYSTDFAERERLRAERKAAKAAAKAARAAERAARSN